MGPSWHFLRPRNAIPTEEFLAELQQHSAGLRTTPTRHDEPTLRGKQECSDENQRLNQHDASPSRTVDVKAYNGADCARRGSNDRRDHEHSLEAIREQIRGGTWCHQHCYDEDD